MKYNKNKEYSIIKVYSLNKLTYYFTQNLLQFKNPIFIYKIMLNTLKNLFQ